MNHTVEQIPASVERIHELQRSIGREAPIEVTMGADITTPDDVRTYEAAGVDRVIVTPWTSSRDAVAAIERFRDEVMAR